MEVLSQAEIEGMLRVASSPSDRLIVRVLAETGCRLGELIGVVAQDGQHFLYLRGKTGERWVAIRRELYRQLVAYISGGRAGRAAEDEPVFLAQRRRDGRHEPPTPSGVQQMIRYLAQEAGIRKRGTPTLVPSHLGHRVHRAGRGLGDACPDPRPPLAVNDQHSAAQLGAARQIRVALSQLDVMGNG
jgi:integrase